MIFLDTHAWVWWVHGDEQLASSQASAIEGAEADLIGASAISCWEVVKLVERERLKLPRPVDEWLELALNYPGVQLIELSPEIAVVSTQLPGEFHKDPADQIIVATARVHGCPLITSDEKIVAYAYVDTI